MTEERGVGNFQYHLVSFNTRLRDLEERGRLVRERVLLLEKNLIKSKEEIDEDIRELKRENRKIIEELDKIKKKINLIIDEIGKFVKRSEMVLIERMLKDFQPLEFMRKKDVEELIEEKLAKKK